MMETYPPPPTSDFGVTKSGSTYLDLPCVNLIPSTYLSIDVDLRRPAHARISSFAVTFLPMSTRFIVDADCIDPIYVDVNPSSHQPTLRFQPLDEL